ncbi:MAG: serine protease Do [Rhodothermales bacterium]|jgi:serine protease Do
MANLRQLCITLFTMFAVGSIAESAKSAEGNTAESAKSAEGNTAVVAASPAKKLPLFDRLQAACVDVLVDGRHAGAGWLATKNGIVALAAHQVDDPGDVIEVMSPSLGRMDAELVAVDMGHDVALLRLEPRKEGYPFLPLARKVPAPGAEIFQFGSPLFRTRVLQYGRVARDSPAFVYYGEAKGYIETYLVSANAQGGTSGGPWVDRNGRVVGIQSGSMKTNDVPVGIAFVSPISSVRRLLASRKTTRSTTGGFAAEELWEQNREFIKRFPRSTTGVVVKSVRKDGPGERAQLRAMDLIVAVDGEPVQLVDKLLGKFREFAPGETVELTVQHPDAAGQEIRQLTLGMLEVAWVRADPPVTIDKTSPDE